MSREPAAAEPLKRAALAFGLEADSLVFVRDVANLVYADADPGRRFLRLTHDGDRSAPDVRAEIDWLRFLAAEALPVARPLEARDGRFVVRPGGGFTAALFERVPGRPCPLEEFGPPVYERMGAFLGRLHRVSAAYRPPQGAPERLHWYELDPPERVLPSWDEGDARLAHCFEEVYARLRSRACQPARYGLVHGDVHRGNIFLHEDRVSVYDFDDCCRAPLAMDVAHALYYALWDRRYLPEPERTAIAHEFLASLLRGYRGEHDFPDGDLAWLPDLLEVRELAVDAFSHRRRRSDPETHRRWAHVRERLARGAPYLEIDLDALASACS